MAARRFLQQQQQQDQQVTFAAGPSQTITVPAVRIPTAPACPESKRGLQLRCYSCT